MKPLLNWRHQKTLNTCLKNMNILKLCVFKQRQCSKWQIFYPLGLIRAPYHAQGNLPAGHFGDSSQNQKWCRCLLQSGWCPGPQPWCRGGRRSDPSPVCWSGRWQPAGGSLARARRSAHTGTCNSHRQHTEHYKCFCNLRVLWTGPLLTYLFFTVKESDED